MFIVIFATLLITVITISFVQLMTREQSQATASDLSQSAYDSAQAGVEDAKRVLLLNQACEAGTVSGSVSCATIASAIASNKCNTVASVFGNSSDTETIVQQSDGGRSSQLDQAYTCVKIDVNTDDYKGEIVVNQSNIVPLRSAGSFDTIEVSWFSREDVSEGTVNIAFPGSAGRVTLPQVGAQWKTNHPAMLRTQFMQTGSSFTLDSFNESQDGGKSNANTLFLYPAAPGAGGTNATSFALDARRVAVPGNAPRLVACKNSFAGTEQYVCTSRISLPSPINGDNANRNAFLRLSALYNGTHYSVKLYNGSTLVQFSNVQPAVDSTGRANDMLRRVQARVELKGDFLYPDAAIDIMGDLCKDFTVTDKPADFLNTTTCTP